MPCITTEANETNARQFIDEIREEMEATPIRLQNISKTNIIINFIPQ
jgi:hypothetical protein